MTCFEIIITVVNIVAVIVAPIIAVVIGQRLQDCDQKRKDKMQIFKVLMTSRMYSFWPLESVSALNMIDVIFVDDIGVRKAWKDLLDAYSSTEVSDLMAKKRQDLKYKLLEEMAKALNYKDKITWETIQNPYVPKGIVDAMQQQQTIQAGQEQLATSMESMINHLMNRNVSQVQSDTAEVDTNAHA